MSGWREWFRGRVVVVTGGASGLGKALVLQLAGLGARAIALDNNDQALGELCGQVLQIDCIAADVRDYKALQGTARELFDKYSRIDVLVNNAGMVAGGPFLKLDPDAFVQSMDVNFWGVVRATYAFWPYLERNPDGSTVVNIASASGLMGLPYVAPYSASKAAVVGLTEAMAAELRGKVRVVLVCPGTVNTRVVRHGSLDLPEEYLAKVEKYMHDHGKDPQKVATQILRAIARGRPFVFPAGGGLKFLWVIKRLSWSLYHAIASRIARYGPEA